jgi:hypothetical protein
MLLASFMPFPPPPETAFTSSGNPTPSASSVNLHHNKHSARGAGLRQPQPAQMIDIQPADWQGPQSSQQGRKNQPTHAMALRNKIHDCHANQKLMQQHNAN